MVRKYYPQSMILWLIWLISASVFVEISPSFYLIQEKITNDQRNYCKKAANLGVFEPIDGSINETFAFSQETGDILTIPISETQAIEQIELTINQINSTQQRINNNEMDKLDELGTSDWGVNSSLGNAHGLSAILDNTTIPNESALFFKINGNEGAIGFSPFDAPSFNESFYSLDNWNITKNVTIPDSYEIALYSSTLVEPLSSKAIQSEAYVMFPEPKRLYRGEINQSFYYSGTNRIAAAELGFNYLLSYPTNTSITLSVWFVQPNGTEIKFADWETTQKGTLNRQEFSNPADFEEIFREQGLYYLIFRFDHFYNASTVGSTTTLLLDEINFQMNFTARDILPNEILYFTQNITHPFIALEDGLLNFNFSLTSFPSLFNAADWAFSVKISENLYPLGSLNLYSANLWNFSQISIPKAILSNRSFEIAFHYQYTGGVSLRLNSTMEWGVYFTNIEFWQNSGYGWVSSQLGLNSTLNSMIGTEWNYIPSSSDPLDPTGILTLSRLSKPWLSDQPLDIQFNTSLADIGFTIKGNYKTVSLSWRDYTLSRVNSVLSLLLDYIDNINGWLFSQNVDWAVLMEIIPFFAYIANQDYRSLLYYGYQSRPSLSRIFTSYIAFIDTYYSFSATDFASSLLSLTTVEEAGSLDETNQLMVESVSTLFMNQKSEIVANYNIFREYLIILALNSPPAALKLSGFSQQADLITARLGYIREGGSGWLSVGDKITNYPAFQYRLRQALNLQNKWSASQIAVVSSCPVQFLESKTIDSQNQIIPAMPLSFFTSQEPVEDYSDEFDVKVLDLKTYDYYLLVLFDLLYSAFQISQNVISISQMFQDALNSPDWNEPNYIASDVQVNGDFNNFASSSNSIFANFSINIDPDSDDGMIQLGAEKIINGNKYFAEILPSISAIPSEISSILPDFDIQTELQFYIPDSSTNALLLINGFLFNTPIESSLKVPILDCLLTQALFRSDTFLRTGQFSLILKIGYRIGNYIFGVNWTEMVGFGLTELGMDTSSIVMKPITTEYYEFSSIEPFALHQCDIAWAPVIPDVGVVNIEWMRNEGQERYSTIPFGEVSGNYALDLESVERYSTNLTIDSVLNKIIIPGPLTGQFGAINFHFDSLNRLKSMDRIEIIQETLTIKLENQNNQEIVIELPIEYRIFPALTLSSPISPLAVYLTVFLVIAGISIIFIFRIRQRFFKPDNIE